jgi:predicted transcriptional regulator
VSSVLSTKRLRQMRKEAGLSQTDLAIEVGVSQAYIARLERGSLDPKLSIANRIIEITSSRRATTCAEIMTGNPVVVNSRDPVSLAITLMQKHSFSQLPVIKSNSILGVITEKDVIRNLWLDLSGVSVETVMGTMSPPVMDESTQVDVVIPLFQTYQAILLTKQGRLTGILTRSDILKLGK